MKRLAAVLIIGLFIAGGLFFWSQLEKDNPSKSGANQSSKSEDKESFNKSRHSLSDPASIWVVINKKRSLPGGYVPPELVVPDVRLRLSSSEEQMKIRPITARAIESMFAAAKADSIELVFGSAYRSEALQKQFYDSYVQESGQEAADTFSARPGHSEHQTGLAADITSPDGSCHLEICFADSPQGRWLAQHAHEHGFIIRYLKDKENITGYQYEPWHLRYVGKRLAKQLHGNGQTMEEFFELPPADQY